MILHVETLQAKVGDLESTIITREGYMYKEIARVLAWERERRQREWESQNVAMESEREEPIYFKDSIMLKGGLNLNWECLLSCEILDEYY